MPALTAQSPLIRNIEIVKQEIYDAKDTSILLSDYLGSCRSCNIDSAAVVTRDFDFNVLRQSLDTIGHYGYNQAPILPLASHDVHRNVIYIGSVCKTVAPVFRVGYLVASTSFVEEAS